MSVKSNCIGKTTLLDLKPHTRFRMSACAIKDTKVMLRRITNLGHPRRITGFRLSRSAIPFASFSRCAFEERLRSRVYTGSLWRQRFKRQECGVHELHFSLLATVRSMTVTRTFLMRHPSSIKYFSHECPKYSNIIGKDTRYMRDYIPLI